MFSRQGGGGRPAARSAPAGEQGAVLVESAVTIGVFLWIVLFTIELALFVFDVNTLHFWLDRVARTTLLAESTVGGVQASVITLLREQGVTTDLSPGDITVCEGFRSSCSTQSTGAAGGFFTVTVSFERRMAALPFSYPVSISVSVRNEGFGAE